MVSLIEFLLARIAEDEEAARAAPGPRWQRKYRQEPEPPFRIQRYAIASPVEFMGEELGSQVLALTEGSGAEDKGLVTHAVYWDPARVLDECAAKRRIVASGLHPLIQILAEPYSWHQEYDPSWAQVS